MPTEQHSAVPRDSQILPCLIRPSLYLSSLRTEVYKDLLDEFGITHILQVGRELRPTHPKSYTYLQLPVWDMPEQDIVGCFPTAFEFIDQALAEDGKVLVHCQAGVSRSASVVIGYCMWKDRMSADAATQAVTRARSVVWPNAGFKCQLREFEQLSWDASKWTGWNMQRYLTTQYGNDSADFMNCMLGGVPVDRMQQLSPQPLAAVPIPSNSLKHAAAAGSRAAAAAVFPTAVAAAKAAAGVNGMEGTVGSVDKQRSGSSCSKDTVVRSSDMSGQQARRCSSSSNSNRTSCDLSGSSSMQMSQQSCLDHHLLAAAAAGVSAFGLQTAPCTVSSFTPRMPVDLTNTMNRSSGTA